MARPREFDTTEALNQAMQVFWAKGYEATSLSDLIGAMELSKSSFSPAFGSTEMPRKVASRSNSAARRICNGSVVPS